MKNQDGMLKNGKRCRCKDLVLRGASGVPGVFS